MAQKCEHYSHKDIIFIGNPRKRVSMYCTRNREPPSGSTALSGKVVGEASGEFSRRWQVSL